MKRELQLKVNIPELSYSWIECASAFPTKGKPGITYRKDVDDKFAPEAVSEALLYYDTDGNLTGILNYFPNDMSAPEPEMKAFAERAGAFNTIVDPERRTLGIGLKLLHEAVRRWPINFEQQNYTPDGFRLVQGFIIPSKS